MDKRREGWMKAHCKRRGILARRLLYHEGLRWPEALAEANRRLECGAKTQAGTPCRRAGRSPNGRCEKHAGLATGARTAEGRERLRQNGIARPRFGNRWATKAEIEAMQAKQETTGA